MQFKNIFLIFLLCAVGYGPIGFASQKPQQQSWGDWFQQLFEKPGGGGRGFATGAVGMAGLVAGTTSNFSLDDFREDALILGPLILASGLLGAIVEKLAFDLGWHNADFKKYPKDVKLFVDRFAKDVKLFVDRFANEAIVPIMDDAFFFPTQTIKLHALLKRDMFVGKMLYALDNKIGEKNATFVLVEACSKVLQQIQKNKLDSDQQRVEEGINTIFSKVNSEIAGLETLKEKIEYIGTLMDVETRAVFSAILAFKFENFLEILWPENTSGHSQFNKATAIVYSQEMRNWFLAISNTMTPEQRALCAIGLQLKYKEFLALLYPHTVKRAITGSWSDSVKPKLSDSVKPKLNVGKKRPQIDTSVHEYTVAPTIGTEGFYE